MKVLIPALLTAAALLGGDEEIAAGAKLYRLQCAACHGKDGQGRGRKPGVRAPSVQGASEEELLSLLKNGRLKKGMPSFANLPEQQRRQIAAFLKSLPPR